MLWTCCTQYASKFGKLRSGHRTGKGQFSFQPQRKTMPKNVQTTIQLCRRQEEHKKSRPWQGPQKKYMIIDKLDAIWHETWNKFRGNRSYTWKQDMILVLENWPQTVSQLASQSHMFYVSGGKSINKNISLSYWFVMDYCFLVTQQLMITLFFGPEGHMSYSLTPHIFFPSWLKV